MKKRLAQFIRRWPALYRLASRIYWTLKYEHLSELVLGTRVREKTWAKGQSARVTGATVTTRASHSLLRR